ncbi:MAG: shikimate kinase [Georgfuchsia sp.]
MPQSIFLVGLMGAGKTTVGRLLAKRLQTRFVDSDHEVAAVTGVNIPTIFDIEGEAGFRRRESETIQRLCQEDNIVMATGGGAVLDPDIRQCLRNRGTVVYLSASPETLYERTRRDAGRPLLQVKDRLSRLRELHQQRDPLYHEVAHLVVEVGRTSAPHVVRQILAALASDAHA